MDTRETVHMKRIPMHAWSGRMYDWLQRMPAPAFVLVGWLATYVILMPLAILATQFPALQIDGGLPAAGDGIWMQVIALIVVAPVLETAIHQWAVIRLLQRFTRFNEVVIVLLSALLFGADHGYSPGYIIFASLLGVVLAAAFLIRDNRPSSPGTTQAFWTVATIHLLHNATTFACLHAFG